MGFRKDHRPEALCSDHQDAGHEEVVIFVLTGALNLLLEALTLNGGYSHHLSSHTLSPSSRPAQESSSVFADETCSNVSCLLDSERFPGRGGRTVLARAIAGLRDHALIARDGNIFCQMPKKRQRVGGGDVDHKKLTGWLCAGRAFLGPWCEK